MRCTARGGLHNGTPGLFFSDIRRLNSSASAFERRLPPERLYKLRLFRQRDDQRRCFAGWLLMVKLLGDNGELDESCLEYTAYGKPKLKYGPEFNLSHSGDFVLLALGEAPVGADIEQWRDEKHMKLARAAFHADELAAFGPADLPRRFYELWTLKESYLKMRGLGLGINPASLHLRLDDCRAVVVGEEHLFLKLYRDIPGYSIALCSLQANWPERPTYVEL